MRKLGRIFVPVAGAAAIIAGMTGTALATTIVSLPGGTPYTGTVRATNIGGNVTLSGNGALGAINTSCTSGTLDAYTLSNGTGGQLTGVTLSGCTNNRGGTTTITALGLPYSGGGVTYAPVAGGRDGYIYVNAPNLAVDIKAVLTLPSLGIPSLECHYTLSSSTPLTINLFNKTNANRPVPANTHSQGTLAGQSLQKKSGTTTCPNSVSANGKFQILTQPGGADLQLNP
ncbi:hypothetical protein [Actinomadura flavalba]|uniref:hypothetical protein n=1 Tax=Actinomadura flavalba TaxID=1120938 RepID=UPI000369DAD1|nr:hypothetical protein [Actinomadura flavalba]